MKRAEAIEYDHTNEVVAIEHFDYAEDAIAWCEARLGAKIEWGDTDFGLRYIECDPSGVEMPGRPIFEVHGYDGKNARELDGGDWRENAEDEKTRLGEWGHTAFLIINKGSGEVYERTELSEVAFIVHGDKPAAEVESDLHWQLKRTGRWDREDNIITVIPSKPCAS